MRLGVQVSIAGKIYKAVDRAKSLGCDCMQIFSRNPRGWRISRLDLSDIEEFKKRRKEAKITPLAVHIPYIINLASPKEKLYKRSIDAYIEDIMRSDALGAEYFVTHLGSHKGTGEKEGLKRFCQALDIVIKETKPKVQILLETTAGSGNQLGYMFEHISYILDNTQISHDYGICIDTAHLFAAGYDIAKETGFSDTLDKFDSIVGLDKIKLIHLNDSKTPLGSRIDRHQHIGKGKIGREAIKSFINHPKLKDLAFILETPKILPKDDPMNLKTVRDLIN